MPPSDASDNVAQTKMLQPHVWSAEIQKQQIEAREHPTAEFTLALEAQLKERERLESTLDRSTKLRLANLRIQFGQSEISRVFDERPQLKQEMDNLSPELTVQNALIKQTLVSSAAQLDSQSFPSLESRADGWYSPYRNLLQAGRGDVSLYTTGAINEHGAPVLGVMVTEDTHNIGPRNIDFEPNAKEDLLPQIKEAALVAPLMRLARHSAADYTFQLKNITRTDSGFLANIYAGEFGESIESIPLDTNLQSRIQTLALAREAQSEKDSGIDAAGADFPSELRRRFVSLLDKRDQIENHLSDSELKNLNTNRLSIAQNSNNGPWLEELKTGMDHIDPEIAAINREITLMQKVRGDLLDRADLQRATQWYDLYEVPSDSKDEPAIGLRHRVQPGEDNPTAFAVIGNDLIIRLEPDRDANSQLEELKRVFRGSQTALDEAKAYGFESGTIARSGSGYQLKLSYLKNDGENKEISVPLDSNTGGSLRQIILDREANLESKYRIDFARAGEQTDDSGGNSLIARLPSYKELDELADALEISAVSLPNAKQPRLKFFFTSTNDQGSKHNDRPIAAGLFLQADRTHLQSRILLYPNAAPNLKESTTHEITHYSQYKNWGSRPSITPPPVLQNLGWEADPRPDTWQLKGKDGNNYCRQSLEDLKNVWTGCPPKSGLFAWPSTWPLGHPSSQTPPSSAKLSDTQMRDMALVTPSTGYFNNPIEMDAEALTQFRLGNEHRSSLRNLNKGMYDVVKDQDQRDINRKYPPVNGEPRRIRLPNGQLAENSAQARDAVERFEQDN